MKIYSIILLLLVPALMMAQTTEERMVQIRDSLNVEAVSEMDNEIPEKRSVYVEMNLGTGFSVTPGYGSGMNIYAAPTLTVPIANRFSMHAGVIASSFYMTSATFQNETGFPSMYSSLSLFVAGSFRMSERLTLHGAGTKQLTNFSAYSPISTYPVDNLSLGATYRFGKNLTIGASVTVHNANGYYSMPSFGHPVSPFGHSNPFTPFGW